MLAGYRSLSSTSNLSSPSKVNARELISPMLDAIAFNWPAVVARMRRALGNRIIRGLPRGQRPASAGR